MLYQKQKGLVLAILLSFAFLCLCSCANPGGVSDTLDILAEPTGELKLYLPPDASNAVVYAITQFQEDFPEVHVELQRFNGEQAQQDYRDILVTSLSAGKGPDLVLFTPQDFSDIHKVLQAQHFMDLDTLFSKDPTFHTDSFQEAVWNSGLYNGERLFVPLSYMAYTLVTTQQSMEHFGIYMDHTTPFEEWSASIIDYIASHKDGSEKNVILADDPMTFFINASGFQALDYATGSIHIQSEPFRSLMEFIRAIYPDYIRDFQKPEFYSSDDLVNKIRNHDLLFLEQVSHVGWLSELSRQIEEGGSLQAAFYAVPVLKDREPFAQLDVCAAIPNASVNKRNAYELLKLLLSNTVQSMMLLPVDNTALRTGGVFQASEFDNAKAYSYYTSLSYQETNARAVIEIIEDAMTPWFEGMDRYETCLTALQNQLELYLYE